ncbi:HTH domain-containing protein [Enterococcus saccharolyticus]|uniref:BglG family transcription antiterminator n=1 Tax=Enterococcus saccharolyticus TaxID=41997 RepID=UPI001E4504E4|nr:HTH domain-containing protein [Enterococcus saccharolyticus]MCD5001968.1 HTH domain-containing protein [Enterococcus saccharolyticus]
MKELNFREISLLNMLLDNEFVSADELLEFSDISLRTLQAEINLLNDTLAQYSSDIQIVNQRGKGYTLEYGMDQPEKLEQLNRHCKKYLNLSLNKRFSENVRIARICRILFGTTEYIKIEAIAEILNVSVATVNKDMRQVRDFLQLYGLTIQSIPYYGMQVAGSEQAIRSCMLDLLNIYSYSEDTLFDEPGLEQFSFVKEDMLQVMAHINSCLRQYPYPLTDNGFRRLTKYLMILSIRTGLQKELTLPEQHLIQQLPAYTLAKALLPTAITAEVEILALFLLAHSENTSWPISADALLPEVPSIYQQIVQKLADTYHLDINQYPDFSAYLQQFLYQFYLRKTYDFKQLEVLRTQRHSIKQFSSSITLASVIYFELPQYVATDLYDQLFLEFVVHIYHIICRLKNEYEPTNILIINDLGKIANESLMQKLHLYNNYDVHYDYRYFYELDSIDFDTYDVVFCSEDFHYDLTKIPIPVMTFNFFLRSEFSTLLWSRILAPKRTIGSVTNYLVHPEIKEVTGKFAQIIQQITDYLIQLPGYQPAMSPQKIKTFIETLILTADYSKYSVNKLITLFSTAPMKKRYFIFHLKEPVTIRDRKISSLQFVFLDVSKGLLEIKNGDSQLRRYTTPH